MERISENRAADLESIAMTVNELLLWLSARSQGSWPQFRTAVEALKLEGQTNANGDDMALALHQQIRFNLERLGHVEFNAPNGEYDWRVVPPILALSTDSTTSIAVLCGARTPRLVESILSAANGLKCDRIAHANCPDIQRISSPNYETLIEVSKEAGVLYQLDAPTALLSHVPKIDSLNRWPRVELPQSGREWEVKRFIIRSRSINWAPSTLKEANRPRTEGLFCFTRFQTPQYFIRKDKETIKLPGAIGKYQMLSGRRHVLRYDRMTNRLTLPAICRPPLLVERALILCSGIPPSISVNYGRTMLAYQNISEEIAALAAEVLRQDLL